MLDLEDRPLVRTAPPKRWRNWYRVHQRMQPLKRVPVWEPGLHPGPDIFPSKDIAEEHALKFIAACRPDTRSWFDHLGAYPDGETPD
jgi:hypothetical protein